MEISNEEKTKRALTFLRELAKLQGWGEVTDEEFKKGLENINPQAKD